MQSETNDDVEEGRKTLKQQLQENKDRKLKEYQEKLQSQNSSYILDESAAQFYADLKKKDLEREHEIKQREAQELRRFKQLQESKKKQPLRPTPIIGDVSIKRKQIPNKTISKPTKVNSSQIKSRLKPTQAVQSPKKSQDEDQKHQQDEIPTNKNKENIVNYSSSDED